MLTESHEPGRQACEFVLLVTLLGMHGDDAGEDVAPGESGGGVDAPADSWVRPSNQRTEPTVTPEIDLSDRDRALTLVAAGHVMTALLEGESNGDRG